MFKRKSTRLKHYDYSQPGYYSVTICTRNMKHMFGSVKNGKMLLNKLGRMVDKWWIKIFEKHVEVEMDMYQIMPNHIHGIIEIVGAIPCNRPLINGRKHGFARTNIIPNNYNGLGQYVSWFKRMSTNEYIRNVKTNNWPPFDKRFWQRSFYDHVIRNEHDLNRIREYIITNPENWGDDEYNV